MDGDQATYERLLREAYDRGLVDGRAAAARGMLDAEAGSDACSGPGPQQLAASLWRRRPGTLPPGLPLNGARWYTAGYRAGLAEQGLRAGVPRPRTAAPDPARLPAGSGGA